jgi:apolipoprotein D and lipocalin family protein
MTLQTLFAVLAVVALTLGACATADSDLRTVTSVDLERYAGTWYEIAKFPTRFQRDCFASTATYDIIDAQTVKVTNACRKGSIDGPEKSVTGKAWVVDKTTNAKLKVRFFWPFSGAYWIIDLGDDYEFAVVGHPERNYLWILSRTPTLPQETYQAILQRLEEQRYDTSRIEGTQHP